MKTIKITDRAHRKLKGIKLAMGVSSFSDAIEKLVDFYYFYNKK